jgi:hypothetical protein
VRVLLWDVHGGYTDSLLHGCHEYLYPPRDERGRGGLSRLDGRCPAVAREVTAEELRDDPPDLVVVQRLEEIDWCADLLRRRPAAEVPAVFLEHNTPRVDVPNSRHPLADRADWQIVHVTHFNELLWDCGTTRTRVVEHAVPDPGLRYTGELARAAFVVNEPVRRWRVTGTDLLPRFAPLPVDAFGIDGDRLPTVLGDRAPGLAFAGNLQPEELCTQLARRRVYLHLNRWTSLGLTLLQAMLLGLPVVVVETTEAARAVPVGAGARSTDVDHLVAAAHRLMADPDEAAACGRRGRAAVLQRYALPRFLADWDSVFAGCCA